MTEYTDEMLMALADGELDEGHAAEMTALVARDPRLAERLALFQETGRTLARVFEPIERAPVPAYMIEAVRRAPIAAPPRPAAANPTIFAQTIVSQLRDFFSAPAGWAAAAAAAFVVVAAGNALVGSGPNRDALGGRDLAVVNRAGEFAPAPVAHALEHVHGGQISQIALADGGTAGVKPLLTFRTRDQQYCREYVVADANAGSRAVACREAAGAWRVVVAIESGPIPTGKSTLPAGRADLHKIDDVVQARIDSIVEAPEEARLVTSGWKEPNR